MSTGMHKHQKFWFYFFTSLGCTFIQISDRRTANTQSHTIKVSERELQRLPTKKIIRALFNHASHASLPDCQQRAVWMEASANLLTELIPVLEEKKSYACSPLR